MQFINTAEKMTGYSTINQVIYIVTVVLRRIKYHQHVWKHANEKM